MLALNLGLLSLQNWGAAAACGEREWSAVCQHRVPRKPNGGDACSMRQSRAGTSVHTEQAAAA